MTLFVLKLILNYVLVKSINNGENCHKISAEIQIFAIKISKGHGKEMHLVNNHCCQFCTMPSLRCFAKRKISLFISEEKQLKKRKIKLGDECVFFFF
ncbi:hypothetical protein X975_16699, partial [Stegodyphus mimosarum]